MKITVFKKLFWSSCVGSMIFLILTIASTPACFVFKSPYPIAIFGIPGIICFLIFGFTIIYSIINKPKCYEIN